MPKNVVLLRPNEALARAYIEERFRDIRGASFEIMRLAANQAVDDLLRGEIRAANTGINALGHDGARDLRAKLKELGFAIE